MDSALAADSPVVKRQKADQPEFVSREHWLAATQQPELELINPREASRSYNDRSRGVDAFRMSLLGSKGEWKAASRDRSRWMTLSLGSMRRVVGIVIQSGSLARAFPPYRVSHFPPSLRRHAVTVTLSC